jgi:hypothetical protein
MNTEFYSNAAYLDPRARRALMFHAVLSDINDWTIFSNSAVYDFYSVYHTWYDTGIASLAKIICWTLADVRCCRGGLHLPMICALVLVPVS